MKTKTTVNFSMGSILAPLLVLGLVLIGQATAFAQGSSASVSDELETLGTNKKVNERAARLESRTRVGIVQGRAVDRNWRVELGATYGPVAFGDPYLYTNNIGANLDLHLTPKFSLGVHYSHSFNQLTAEGQQRFDQARQDLQSKGDGTRPQVSYPEDQVMGVVNWYMTYGKINLFDWRVVQFDIYSLAGYGQIKVSTELGGETTSEWKNTWTAGGGIGFWLSQHVTSRFELRYQSYSDKVYTGSRDLNLVIANFGLGVLL